MDLSKINRREKELHNELHILNKRRFENKFYKGVKQDLKKCLMVIVKIQE